MESAPRLFARIDQPAPRRHTQSHVGPACAGRRRRGCDRGRQRPELHDRQSGVIRWTNAAAQRLFGDLRGRQFTSVVAPEDTRRAREAFAQKIAGTAQVTDLEIVLVDSAGKRVAVDISSVPLHRGERLIGVFGQFVQHQDAVHRPAEHAALTPRQTEILRQLERGRSTRQIAQELHLSPDTVRNHVRHVLKALGVSSRLEAVAVSRREHVVTN